MTTVTAKEARQNFSELLNKAFYANETILITRSGKPVVIMTKAKKLQKKKESNKTGQKH